MSKVAEPHLLMCASAPSGGNALQATAGRFSSAQRVASPTIIALPEMQEWIAAARLEPAEIDEVDMDF